MKNPFEHHNALAQVTEGSELAYKDDLAPFRDDANTCHAPSAGELRSLCAQRRNMTREKLKKQYADLAAIKANKKAFEKAIEALSKTRPLYALVTDELNSTGGTYDRHDADSVIARLERDGAGFGWNVFLGALAAASLTVVITVEGFALSLLASQVFDGADSHIAKIAIPMAFPIMAGGIHLWLRRAGKRGKKAFHVTCGIATVAYAAASGLAFSTGMLGASIQTSDNPVALALQNLLTDTSSAALGVLLGCMTFLSLSVADKLIAAIEAQWSEFRKKYDSHVRGKNLKATIMQSVVDEAEAEQNIAALKDEDANIEYMLAAEVSALYVGPIRVLRGWADELEHQLPEGARRAVPAQIEGTDPKSLRDRADDLERHTTVEALVALMIPRPVSIKAA